MNVHELLRQLQSQKTPKSLTQRVSAEESHIGTGREATTPAGESQSREGSGEASTDVNGAPLDSSPAFSPTPAVAEFLQNGPKPSGLERAYRLIEKRKQARLREQERMSKEASQDEDGDWRRLMQQLGRT